MDVKKFNEYVEDRYNKEVDWYDKKSISNKKWNNFFQILVIVIAAVLPISAVLEYKWPTVILSAIVAVCTGILKFCKFEDTLQAYPHYPSRSGHTLNL